MSDIREQRVKIRLRWVCRRVEHISRANGKNAVADPKNVKRPPCELYSLAGQLELLYLNSNKTPNTGIQDVLSGMKEHVAIFH